MKTLPALVPALLLLLTACGGDPTGASGVLDGAAAAGGGAAAGGAAGTIAISATGDVEPADHADPLPIGTVFTFDGWSATVTKVEHSTQDSPSPTNPRASVIQADLELTAPQESEADYQDRPPFAIKARTNASDMVPCGTDDPWSAPAPGETLTLTTCLAYSASDEVARETPIVTVVARYGGVNEAATLTVESTRGPDY